MAPAHRSIFVSYTLRDRALDLTWLAGLASEIHKFARPYVDVLHNDSADHQGRVVDELLRASVILACPSPGYLASPWVRLELSMARSAGLPIVCLPSSLDLAQSAPVLRLVGAGSGLREARTPKHRDVGLGGRHLLRTPHGDVGRPKDAEILRCRGLPDGGEVVNE